MKLIKDMILCKELFVVRIKIIRILRDIVKREAIMNQLKDSVNEVNQMEESMSSLEVS